MSQHFVMLFLSFNYIKRVEAKVICIIYMQEVVCEHKIMLHSWTV